MPTFNEDDAFQQKLTYNLMLFTRGRNALLTFRNHQQHEQNEFRPSSDLCQPVFSLLGRLMDFLFVAARDELRMSQPSFAPAPSPIEIFQDEEHEHDAALEFDFTAAVRCASLISLIILSDPFLQL